MSHIVQIQTEVRDEAAVQAACSRLHLLFLLLLVVWGAGWAESRFLQPQLSIVRKTQSEMAIGCDIPVFILINPKWD